jgi:hypothetical protein
VYAGKCVENRSRRDGGMPQCCSHRGKLLLHASGSMTRKEYREAVAAMHSAGLVRLHEREPGNAPLMPSLDDVPFDGFEEPLPLGGIIGICDVIGHLTPDRRLVYQPGTRGHPVRDYDDDDGMSLIMDLRWWGGGYALVLDNVRPLPFVRCKGSRGLWDAPKDVLEKLAA